GIPLLAGTVLLVATVGRRLLPDRQPANLPTDLGQHARTLARQYAVGEGSRLFSLRDGSPLLGATRDLIDSAAGISLIAVSGPSAGGPQPRTFAAGDVLVLRGDPETLSTFAQAKLLDPVPEADDSVADMLFSKHAGLAEVVVKPRSKLVGLPMTPGSLTESGQFVVVAIQRNGEDVGRASMNDDAGTVGTTLQAGDHLLLQGTWQALNRLASDPDVLLVDSPEAVRRQAVPLGSGSRTMLAILAAMVLVLSTGVLPAAVGVLVAAMAVIATGILTVPQAYRAIDLNTVILVASMIPLSTAMNLTGAAAQMADLLVATIGGSSPAMLLAGLFLFTAVLGQVISNTATAMIVIPIAVAAAGELGLSAKPVLMSLNVGASAAFLTPVATTSNLIVMAPGGYRFGDYWKLGLLLMMLYFVVAVFWVPVVWRL
ncbi:MAG: SLC13 family permease, partial [Aestuariivirga sp.]